jgi:hypothetical protein
MLDNVVLYNAMVDESIFSGDAEEDYQFEMWVINTQLGNVKGSFALTSMYVDTE